jgi:hypothetical protein
VGCGSAIVTAGRFGSVMMWPEAELRSIAEAAGFVLPPPLPSGNVPGELGARLSVSEVCAWPALPQRPPLLQHPHCWAAGLVCKSTCLSDTMVMNVDLGQKLTRLLSTSGTLPCTAHAGSASVFHTAIGCSGGVRSG